ncbi:aspartate kinase [Eubacterium limosum]|uniref:Aspartokinase n=1 Tax=Eubacterium limosum TaxID=1736 RepID=A0ABT5ULP5_EUBLI|nr:aspartate kinase [Eubacterium limosum]MCB6570041.1 aspartate kinase [Eubacterium limosum]MDE1469834.1 aspartate kinase [Eubacterium limosum]
MSIIVQKYGGTSMGTIDRIKNVARRIIKKREEGNQMVVVVSAMGKSTDELIKMAYSISDAPPRRELDMLLATGEQVSISMLSMALNAMGYDAISFTGPQVGVHTMGHHGKSRIMDIETRKIEDALNDGKIVIIAGFQGVNENDDITTLGRGGSDTSAVALSCVLECPCEIYTDVDGIYGVDPRLYPPAKKLSTVSFDEMLEMASLGAGVMHARAIELGSKYNAEIYVASSIHDVPGTLIKEGDSNMSPMEQQAITGLAIDNDELMVSLKNVPFDMNITAQFFSDLAKKSINIDMISQTAPVYGAINISFSAPIEDLSELRKILYDFMEKYPQVEMDINKEISKLSVVGIGMRSQSGVAAKFFQLLADNNIPMLMITTSEIRISCVIPSELRDTAVMSTADAFDL